MQTSHTGNSTKTESEETDADGTPEGEGARQGSISRVIIYKGASAGTPQDLSNPESFSARLSRARGGRVDSISSTDDEPSRRYDLSLDEGQLYSDTGLFMRFRNPEDTQFTGGDLLTDPDEPSYVVPQTAADALPFEVRDQLESAGFAMFTGAYSEEQERFYGVSLGWDEALASMDPVMIQMKLINETAITETPALDFVLAELQDVNPAEIARAREVGVRTVENNIQRGRKAFRGLL